MNILILDASPRRERSRSRNLSRIFKETWTKEFPDDEIVPRNLPFENPVHITEEWMQAAYTPPEKRTIEQTRLLSCSDNYVTELKAADYMLIACPMYNFSVPSALKAYIDQVFRLGETFRLDKGQYVGLLKGKKAFVICTKGGIYSNQKMYDFASPYVEHVFKTLGFEDIEMIDVEGLDISKDHEKLALENAHIKIRSAISRTKEKGRL